MCCISIHQCVRVLLKSHKKDTRASLWYHLLGRPVIGSDAQSLYPDFAIGLAAILDILT